MINEYIDSYELKRLFTDKILRPENIKFFYRKRGIYLASSSIEDIAEQAYTIFLGVEDLDELQNLMNTENSYIQSAVFELSVPDSIDDTEDFFDTLADDINATKSWSNTPCVVERTIRENADVLSFNLQYEKQNKGSNRLASKETRTVEVHMRKTTQRKIAVDVRIQNTSDLTKAIAFIELLSNDPTDVDAKEKFKINHLNLDSLLPKHQVEFFDALAADLPTEWRLVTINGMTIKRKANSSDDEEEETLEEKSSSEENTNLAGISHAILNGQGLRTNSFVMDCLDKGFIISSMKYRFSMVDNATEFIIGISNKKGSLHVDMVKSFRDEEGKPTPCPFDKAEQDTIVKKFQGLAKEKYASLWETQKHESIYNSET